MWISRDNTDINNQIKNVHRIASTQKDNTQSQINDNINMDSTIAGELMLIGDY
jgi:hypothetical protein